MPGTTLFSIGEARIEMIPTQADRSLEQVSSFCSRAGGSAANVCGAFSRLGGRSCLLTQLGNDPFGHRLARELADAGVDLSHLSFTDQANTALAFIGPESDPAFSFCQKNSADLLYPPERIDPAWFREAFALHFGSASLVDSPMRFAHLSAIAAARQAGAIISFSPSLWHLRWHNDAHLRQTVQQFLPLADLVRVSDDDLEFLTGSTDIEPALFFLFSGSVQLVLHTRGSKGASAYTRTRHCVVPACAVQAVDPAGAGDGFTGSFLWQLARAGVTRSRLSRLSARTLEQMLRFSHQFCATSIQRPGALSSYPTLEQMPPQG